jgi:hypothetical protein
MKRIVMAVALALLALFAAAAVTKGTESKWEVKKGATKIATVTLLSNARSSRAEWQVDADSAPIVLIAAKGTLWIHQHGGDIESKDYKGGIETSIAPALMKNAEHASKLTLAGGYTANRLSLAHPIIDAEIFTIRPKKGTE